MPPCELHVEVIELYREKRHKNKSGKASDRWVKMISVFKNMSNATHVLLASQRGSQLQSTSAAGPKLLLPHGEFQDTVVM